MQKVKISQMFNKVPRLRKEAEEKNKILYRKTSANKLSKNIEKKIRTTFIGNINTVEKYFGELWGHGKEYKDLTDEEKRERKVWDACRKEMLDKGNNELRAANTELGEYTVEWNRFHKDLPFIGGQENG
jgi:hypothetical protein